MPKAEVGSTKYLANRMKSKGLQRLRWYCQLCERQCRDENGFKMHTQSESHMRKALSASENFKGIQEDFSKAFLKDFVDLLKTGHREKAVHVNKFYQEYIARKDAVHMNATKWNSLTEFAKYLGRESICRVEERDDGLFIAWIDDSPEALKRKAALRKKELQDKGDEEREQMLLKEQIRRAQKDADEKADALDEDDATHQLMQQPGEKVKLTFGTKPTNPKADSSKQDKPMNETTNSESLDATTEPPKTDPRTEGDANGTPKETPKPVSLKMGIKPQPKNVFKNALVGGTKKVMVEQPKKMSEAERIMKEEIERKRSRDARGANHFPNKKPRT